MRKNRRQFTKKSFVAMLLAMLMLATPIAQVAAYELDVEVDMDYNEYVYTYNITDECGIYCENKKSYEMKNSDKQCGEYDSLVVVTDETEEALLHLVVAQSYMPIIPMGWTFNDLQAFVNKVGIAIWSSGDLRPLYPDVLTAKDFEFGQTQLDSPFHLEVNIIWPRDSSEDVINELGYALREKLTSISSSRPDFHVWNLCSKLVVDPANSKEKIIGIISDIIVYVKTYRELQDLINKLNSALWVNNNETAWAALGTVNGVNIPSGFSGIHGATNDALWPLDGNGARIPELANQFLPVFVTVAGSETGRAVQNALTLDTLDSAKADIIRVINEIVAFAICEDEGHTWGGWVNNMPTPGQRTRTCTRCGETQTVLMPVTPPVNDGAATTNRPAGTPAGPGGPAGPVGGGGFVFADPNVPLAGTPYFEFDETNVPLAAFITFVDITGHWAESYITNMFMYGLMRGVDDLRFAPDDVVTRAMVATTMWRLAGSPLVHFTPFFSDIAEDEWYSIAVVWAFQNGIVQGFGDGTFNPHGQITREQLAAMMYRYAQFDGRAQAVPLDHSLAVFQDRDMISDWALEYVYWASFEGLITGVAYDSINPGGTATRAQFAAILDRF